MDSISPTNNPYYHKIEEFVVPDNRKECHFYPIESIAMARMHENGLQYCKCRFKLSRFLALKSWNGTWNYDVIMNPSFLV